MKPPTWPPRLYRPACRSRRFASSRRRWRTCSYRRSAATKERGEGERRENGASLPWASTLFLISHSSADSAPAVTVDRLERRFGRFMAVNRVSFEVKRGEIFGFLGPNGAGKSTTIRMLCGILSPTGGRGTVAGLDIRTQAEADQGQRRLHEPEVLALPGPDRRGEHQLLLRHLSHRREGKGRAQAVGDRNVGPGGASPSPHRGPLRRLEAAAGAGLRDPPSAADPLSRRADLRRRSDQPPPVLGFDLRAVQRGRDRLRHHALHGRGRILRPAGADLSRRTDRPGAARAAQARGDARGRAGSALRTARSGDGGPDRAGLGEGSGPLRQQLARRGRRRRARPPTTPGSGLPSAASRCGRSRRSRPRWRTFSSRSSRPATAPSSRRRRCRR